MVSQCPVAKGLVELVTGEVSSTWTWRVVYFAIWKPNVYETLNKYFTKFFLDSNGIYE